MKTRSARKGLQVQILPPALKFTRVDVCMPVRRGSVIIDEECAKELQLFALSASRKALEIVNREFRVGSSSKFDYLTAS